MIVYLGNKLSTHGFTPTSVETLGARIPDLGFEVITKSSKLNKLLRLIDMATTIFKYRKRKPVVVIDTYSQSAFWYAVISAIICISLKLKYILVLRGGDLPERLNNSPKISELIYKKSYTNVAVSGYLKNEFEKKGFTTKVIHNYIDIKNYPFKIRKNIQPHLLWVRAFHKTYNPVMAIKVAEILKNDFPFVSVKMIGPHKDDTMEECKKAAAQAQVNIEFTGKLDKKEWIKQSAEYDIFINTTNYDNAPISVMEAMALGMPVVTTNAGGVPYLFSNGVEGIMVNKNDAPAMASAIMELINNSKKTEELSIAARKKAEQWDWEFISREWESLLKEALSESKKN